MKNLNFARSKYASEKINSLINKTDVDKKEYRSRAREFPSLVKEDLLQTLIFYYSKKDKNAYGVFAQDLLGWFARQEIQDVFGNKLVCNNNKDIIKQFIEKVHTLNTFEYLLLSDEVIRISVWFKRFATALIPRDN